MWESEDVLLQGMIEFREELARKGSSMLEAACRSALGSLFLLPQLCGIDVIYKIWVGAPGIVKTL
jgi:hypothetical protein